MIFVLLGKLKQSLLNLSWPVFLLLLLIHNLSSWLLMTLFGEDVSQSATLWFYYYSVTASTVGYGDYSPESLGGQWVATLWLIPGGISLFAAAIGKIAAGISSFWRQSMLGTQSFDQLVNHTVILGWHGDLTLRMVDILLLDPNLSNDIVLCVRKDIENPLPGKVRFVRGDSFSQPELLKRAGISHAARILLYAENDEECLATALAVSMMQPSGHVVARCQAESTARMLRHVLPNIECIQGMAVELLVRSAQDPGASEVITELLSLDVGPAQFQLPLPNNVPDGLTYQQLLMHLFTAHNATLLGAAKAHGKIELAANPDLLLQAGDRIFYMAHQRLQPSTLFKPTLESRV